ncbi:glycosyltransferase 87 family protein [Leptolinea tardivitalis]|uniref:DUF2029 domain-containing protein n=1 Tax=Leptolinea tardivitalis TaxID=229920 RepID=A0A0P6X0N2_9CHLR|nr:glycosyltransferase 87 family protein [Leptolinea tardivitalis]KPL72720.1 hypothetical protein ADM99_06470 [Leptolinea tardivitalis]GAP20935.1 hypothetical protein LTAR_01136 [Leptolinea tardivitalis]
MSIMRKLDGKLAAGVFIILRCILFFVMPYSAYLGFGDQLNFYRLAQIPGWPFFDYWVEFPPIFPFISTGLYRLAGGDEKIYCYMLASLLTLFDAGSILIFWKLVERTDAKETARVKLSLYTLFLSFFPYGWWYFDPMAVFLLLLGLWFALTRKQFAAGLTLGLGFLVKIFPALVLPIVWKRTDKKSFLKTFCLFSITILVTLGFLWLFSLQMTTASLSAQYSKGSWQTVWALLDGNLGTGNFGPLTDRWDPAKAFHRQGNPAKIPAIVPFSIAVCIGFWILLKSVLQSDRQLTALVGVAWSLLILVSPGWSPQWILYIIPLILLVLPINIAALYSLLLIGLSLIEWPILFSRSRIDLLWIVVLMRTMLILIAGIHFARITMKLERAKRTI